MGRWTDLAEWRGPTINEGDGDSQPNETEDRAVECRGAVLHIADGYYEGTISWQKNPAADVSSHFVVAGPRDVPRGRPDGRIAQVVDTDIRAWTQRDGNGHWLSIECSGFSGDSLSAAQIEACARILAKGHQVYGYPLQIATSPTGRGLGHHSMGTNGLTVPTDTWTGPTWGHEQCPGPAIVAQKRAILARAIQIVNGVTQQEDDMAFLDDMDARYLVYREYCWANMVEAVTSSRGEVITHKGVATVNALVAAVAAIAVKVDISPAELEEIKQAAGAGVAAAVPAIVDALVARLPADTLSREDVEDAVRGAFAGGLAPDTTP